jgi:non-specific serine/threonine protein kinase/serine/threonine-protein kinase
MGEVWLAEQTHPVRRQVALKVIKAGMDTAQVVSRFEAERQALALMDHPAIATVFDGGSTPEGRPYFAMEYVKGEPITTYCDQQRLGMTERLALFIHVCEGVQHAHQKGVIHRDLKPSNVLVTLQDGQPVPKIIDFGVAKATTQPLTERTLYTELGVMIGTPEYMSPEQARLTGLDIDTRSDVYALGVLLYELLTGALPFDRQTLREKALEEIQRTIREVDPPKPSTKVTQLGPASTGAARNRHTETHRLASELRGDLDWITMKCLEKDRTRRYGSASELAADLRRHLDSQPVVASPPSTVYRARKFVRRHRFGVAAATAVGVLLMAFAVTMAVQAQRIARERDRANREAETARQISAFLVGLFKVSDPSEARGNTLTARELLDRGARDLDERLRDQPELQSRLQSTIGGVFNGLGFYERAEALLERALETERRVLGEDDPQTLATLNQLANAYWYRQRFKEAEPLYVDVVERRRRTLGPEHPDTLRASWDLASVYLMTDRLADGERLLLEVLEIQRRTLGEEHPDALDSLNNLQSVYYQQKRYDEALPIALQVLAARRKAFGEDHPATLRAMHNLATVHDKLGHQADAEAMYLETIARERRVLGEQHRSTCNTSARLAEMYQSQRRFAEAEPLLVAAYQGYSKTFGPDQERTRQVLQQIAALYEDWGKSAKAAEWRAKLPKPAAPSSVK